MQAADDRTLAASSKPEKSVGQNPPDIVLSCDKETAEDPNEEVVVSELMTAKCQLPETTKPVSQSVDRVFDKYSVGNSYGNTSPLNKVIASCPNKKPVCSRRKLFRTPGSLNYRRMLPYIRRDIQGGNYDKLTTRPEFVRVRNQGRGEREDYGLWFFNSHVFMHLLCTFHCFFVSTQFIIFRK